MEGAGGWGLGGWEERENGGGLSHGLAWQLLGCQAPGRLARVGSAGHLTERQGGKLGSELFQMPTLSRQGRPGWEPPPFRGASRRGVAAGEEG